MHGVNGALSGHPDGDARLGQTPVASLSMQDICRVMNYHRFLRFECCVELLVVGFLRMASLVRPLASTKDLILNAHDLQPLPKQ